MKSTTSGAPPEAVGRGRVPPAGTPTAGWLHRCSGHGRAGLVPPRAVFAWPAKNLRNRVVPCACPAARPVPVSRSSGRAIRSRESESLSCRAPVRLPRQRHTGRQKGRACEESRSSDDDSEQGASGAQHGLLTDMAAEAGASLSTVSKVAHRRRDVGAAPRAHVTDRPAVFAAGERGTGSSVSLRADGTALADSRPGPASCG